MPLVFIHGVSTREDARYRKSQKVRDGLFRKFVLAQLAGSHPATIKNPYWGQFGARFYWDHASLPAQQYQAFGSGTSVYDEVATDVGAGLDLPPERFLSELARVSLARAVDALWAAAAFTDADEDPDALAASGWAAAQYVAANPTPAWLQQVRTDDEFMDRLLVEIDRWAPAAATPPGVESFGIRAVWNRVKTAGQHLLGAAAGLALNPAVPLVRPWLHHRVSLFTGDVFEYLTQRGEPGAEGDIVRVVCDDLTDAAAATGRDGDDKLIVVAHSMGGNIAYDVLTHFLPELKCDLLLTVGSQVGLFEELKLFRSSDRSVPSANAKTVPKPRNVVRWINVMDRNDVLAYATSRIFADSEDMAFDTETHPFSAHSMYFYRPHFHQRLNARLQERRT